MCNYKQFVIGITLAVLCASLAAAENLSVAQIQAELTDAPVKASAPAASDVDPVDAEAVLSESQEYYVAADYLRARQGFESVLAEDPGNSIAAYYLNKIRERARRNAEEDALEIVESSWNGMIFRDYSLATDALKTLGVADAAEALDVSANFPEVDFPEGAYAIYRPSLNRLFVQNTQANMSRMEAIMASLGAPKKGAGGQVAIKARFVEFSEGALEELGFEWSAPDGADLPGDWSVNADQSLFADSLRSVPFSQTGALGLGEVRDPASTGWSVNRIEDMFSDEAGTLEFSGTLDSDAVDLLVRALDQTSGADVLSAPSIVTLSGKEATIKVGERHNYPSTYEEGTSGGTVLHVRYEDFEDKILGVEMDVTPTISGNEINLEINPKITELAGWQQFQLAAADTSYTWYQFRVGLQFEHEPVVARLPVFKRREIQTEISVANGATIGMGGLISEKVESFEDRVPMLGSIPLVGRLFRSEGQRSVKRNLMIFVTATRVEPNGRMVSERSFE